VTSTSEKPSEKSSSENTESKAAARARTPRPVKRRSEGQWALGYREPLNIN
jgi:sulfite reductase (ferredoxin)